MFQPCRRVNAALTASLLVLQGALSATTSGEFNILAMNVAGLPEILNGNEVPGDKTTNAGIIGSRFAEYDYDVIHVQEDFNYHAYIYATDDHPYRTATSGGVPIGSGLNTLSNFDWVSFDRVKWDTCSDASENDCLTPKGYTFMRVAIATSNSTSTYIDMYNLHTDAGTEDGDEVARNSNVNQVAARIAASSTGNAVLVFGDTNSRYTRVADTAIRALLASENAAGPGLTDAWVELERGGVVPTVETVCDNPSTTNACETVDKVFYRGSALVELSAAGWTYASARFLQSNGSVLSDHNPVNVDFAWAAGGALRQSAFWGGPHGDWFSDVPTLAGLRAKPKPTLLSFRGASRLDAVGLTLADGTVFAHGGTGGDAASLALGAGEVWLGAELCQGEKSGQTRNFWIRATTNVGRTLEAGTRTDDCTSFAAPSGWQIVGFLGQDGDEMDQLAFVYAPQ
ncbi:Endonuclease/exonuclease/phosphatase [Epithele typhae]|uniref:Endonuclease/exonuclease/phosphatase n=1 Tax=Epithele typhae TaxID=378194 RepID=UPI0020086E28|nr:Endonuclease/exonuclease/phosphatase [Epithele typhae]KAH9942493.1 Endonuclease/exonuclease/phosphatase [Epithele typhae]